MQLTTIRITLLVLLLLLKLLAPYYELAISSSSSRNNFSSSSREEEKRGGLFFLTHQEVNSVKFAKEREQGTESYYFASLRVSATSELLARYY